MMFSENMASVGGSEADRKSRKSAANTSVVDNNTSLNNSSDIHDDSAIRKHTPASTSSSTIHWFAQVGSDVPECWDDGAIDRDERLRMIKDRQNEERQRKLEELKAQAVAAQRYREQKEEERRRRIDDMRTRELDRKQQVDERKRAIEDAEKDRRDYILRRNQERDSRIETKKRNERSSIAFAFGSSTPRLLDPVDVGSMSPSSMWGHRRSTSISNVAYSGAPLSRRSSERELSDVPKKRATSAGGLDRNDDQRKMSTSMYEVFNWGSGSSHLHDTRPNKRYSLAIAGSHIDIDDVPAASSTTAQHSSSNSGSNHNNNSSSSGSKHHHQSGHSSSQNRTDDTDAAHLSYRSVARRKTDLMPTIPSPRDGFGSRSSLYCHTPRTPVRAGSMTRLDQLAQPTRRNGEHIRAVIERQRMHNQSSPDSMSSSVCSSTNFSSSSAPTKHDRARRWSRSLTHLATHKFTAHANASGTATVTSSTPKPRKTGPPRPLSKTAASSKSMSTLNAAAPAGGGGGPSPYRRAYEKAKQTMRVAATSASSSLDGYGADANGSGSRSGDVTPGTSRPGSALSTSTSVSGVVYRRSTGGTTPRKPRPASIAGTDDANKLRKEKPPLPRVAMRKSMTSSTNGLHTSGTSTPAAQPSTPKETPKRTAAPSRVSSVKKATPRPMSMSMTASMISGNSTSAAPVAVKSKTPEPESLVSSGPQSLDTASFIITTPAKTEVEQVASSVINEIVATATDVVAQKAASIDRDSIERDSIEGDANTEEIDQPQSVEDEPQIVVQEPAAVQPPQPKPTIKAVSELNSSNHLNDATDNGDIMTASMIKRISTEEEAKAALAERRRLARIEADRLAEIERQRVEAEERAEEQRIAEEEEAQRKFEEETLRLAEAQRKAEELRLAEAIEEAAQREKDEIQRREDEERQKVEREEQERKAREEAERQKIEVAERLKKEEKEREERRKRVEAIMSRTRAKGAAATPNKNDDKVEADKTSDSSNSSSTSETITTSSKPVVEPVAAVVVPAAPVTEAIVPQTQSNPAHTLVDYEKTVTDKENTLINSFSNLIINNQDATELLLHQSNGIAPIVVATPKTNGKALNFDTVNEDDAVILRTSTPATNGNGHTTDHSLDNQIELTTDVVTTATVLVDNNKMQQGLLAGSDAANQLIDFSLDATTTVPQQLLVDTGADDGVLVNFNNNSLTTAGAGGAPNLVTSDSHEHKDISLL